ncbi:LysM peptidoglycan-binding domain-containing protein, partial [Roseibium aggregatum]
AEAPAATAEEPAAKETTPAVEVTATASGQVASDQATTDQATAEPAETAPAARTVSAPAAELVAKNSLTATVEAVESEGSKLYVAGTGEPGLKVRVYVAGEFVGEAKIGPNGRWLLEGSKTLKPGTVEVRADMIGDDKGTVVARAAVNFEKAAEQIVLTKVIASGETATDAGGAGATVTKPLPNVIIHKGDNLWTISRRLYGKGIRYTTIYQANKGQIRNPDLIYPGQVFLTPESDLNWKPESN